MKTENNEIHVNEMILLILILINALVLKMAFIINENWYHALVITLPLLLIAVVKRRKGSRW